MSTYPTYKLGDVAEIILGQSLESKSYNTQGEGLPFFQGKTEFTDWRIERLPECRFDLWPRKWDGKAVLILDDIERKRNSQMLETEICNNEIRLLLQFCSIPFVLKMRFTEFMQCIDFSKLSRHELKTLAWLIVGYFYTESKKMRTATTKTEFGFASDSVIRWSYDREEITNFLIEKTSRYFELLAKRKKRTEKTLC